MRRNMELKHCKGTHSLSKFLSRFDMIDFVDEQTVRPLLCQVEEWLAHQSALPSQRIIDSITL